VYDHGVIYHQNNLCGVWQYAGGSTWNQTTLPVDVLSQIPELVLVQCPRLGGVWTATPAEGMTAVMLSTSLGDFFYETVTATCVGFYSGSFGTSTNNLQYDSPVSVYGSGSFSPSYYTYYNNSSCPGAEPDTFSGTLVPGSSLQLTTTGGISGGVFTINWTPMGLTNSVQSVEYDELSSLSAISGNWIGDNTGFGQGGLTISSTGAFSTEDASCDCILTGQVALMNQPYSNATVGSYNMYSFTASILQSVPDQGDPHSAGTETGLLTIINGNQLIWGGTITNGASVTSVMHTLTR
jgi:hypothetical protein